MKRTAKRVFGVHIPHYFFLLLGTMVYALSFSYFLRTAELVAGGVSGISMIINYKTGFPIGTAVILMNIPIFIIGFKTLGLKFMIDSLIAMLVSSFAIDFIAPYVFPLTTNPLLACIYGGAIDGFACGIVFRVGASSGGSDVIAKITNRYRPDFNIGQVLLGINVLVLVAYCAAMKFESGVIEKAMYSGVAMFIASYVIDLVLYGIHYGKLIFVISDKEEEIATRVTEELNRGATILQGEGAYTHDVKRVLMLAVKKRRALDVKRLIHKIDPQAFVIVTETKEILGKGFDL